MARGVLVLAEGDEALAALAGLRRPMELSPRLSVVEGEVPDVPGLRVLQALDGAGLTPLESLLAGAWLVNAAYGKDRPGDGAPWGSPP